MSTVRYRLYDLATAWLAYNGNTRPSPERIHATAQRIGGQALARMLADRNALPMPCHTSNETED